MSKAILLDIEGTTTPIDFVHKTLFPFAKRRMGEFVRTSFENLAREINLLADEHSADNAYGKSFDSLSPDSVAAYLDYLIEQDRKSTPLKSIQGEIWKTGYESGELKSIVFDDVPLALQRWNSDGKMVAIYSSGSVLAQRLLFRNTNHGDLSPLINEYFDTNMGGKRESESYRRIAEALRMDPGGVQFVSDVVAELDAAQQAGMITALSLRPGNAEITEDTIHRIVKSFDDLPV